jgi:hypothetical protein
MRLVAALIVFSFACSKQNPEACCTTQEDCDAIGLPLGTDCADGLTCIFNRCILATCDNGAACPTEVPQCSPTGQCVECLDNTQCDGQVCDPGGTCVACTLDDECGDGFCVEGTCRSTIVPAFLPEVCDSTVETDLVLTTSFDTTTDATMCSDIIAQAGGPEICVIHVRSISIPTGMTVKVTGAKALALVADQDLTIDGTLDISADLDASGPGGGVVVSGGAPTSSTGGGGAGFGEVGGAGGSTSDGGAANGGVAVDQTGSAILHGGTSGAVAGRGGGGGGAITLISCRGVVRVAGLIDAGGGGGDGGANTNSTTVLLGGFGGGSGGHVAIQAVDIVISGQTFANGGGGGGGSSLNTQAAFAFSGGNGENGTRSSTVPAAGGTIGKGPTVGGGSGGARTAAGDGKASVPLTNGSGGGPSGGGGGVGLLQTFMPNGRLPDLTTATTSPVFTANQSLGSR